GESEQQALAYGQEIPMIDPTDKTIDFNGKRYRGELSKLGDRIITPKKRTAAESRSFRGKDPIEIEGEIRSLASKNKNREINEVNNREGFNSWLLSGSDTDNRDPRIDGKSSTNQAPPFVGAFDSFSSESRGVLLNVRSGGIKRDMNTLLETDVRLVGEGSLLHSENSPRALNGRGKYGWWAQNESSKSNAITNYEGGIGYGRNQPHSDISNSDLSIDALLLTKEANLALNKNKEILSLTGTFNSNSISPEAFEGLVEYGSKIKNGKSVANIVTGGNRSGDFAISRDSIDSFLNNPDRSNNKSLVQKEIARRELQVVESDENLIDGRKAYADRDYESAVNKYKEALTQMPQGPIAAERRKAYMDQLLDGSIALSQQYRRTGRYTEARGLIEGVLKEDPGNVVAKKHLEYLDDPIRTSPTLTHTHVKNVEQVRKQLYIANSYYDQAQFEKATAEYKETLRLDPYNKAARRGMEKVSAAKSDYYRAAYDQTRAAMLTQVDQAWEMAVPPAKLEGVDRGREMNVLGQQINKLNNRLNEKPIKSTEPEMLLAEKRLLSETDMVNGRINKGQNEALAIRNKLTTIQLPLVEFDDEATVGDAINFLRSRARELDSEELDPNKKGLSFAFRNPSVVDSAGSDAVADIDKIEDIKLGGLKLRNIPMDEALRQIVQVSGLRYKTTDQGIVLLKATDTDDNEMYARTFRVPANFEDLLRFEDTNVVDDDPFGDAESSSKESGLKELIERQGIKFPEGATVGFSEARGTLTVRNTAQSLDYVEELVDSLKPRTKTTPDFSRELSAAKQTHSTFSLNVSDVSYKLAKSVLLEKVGMPEAAKIRVEEFVNAFDYGDPSVSNGKKVNCVVEQCAHPFYQQRNLMRIGMKTGAMGRSKPLRLTVLLDNSGSMEREDRAATVVKAIESLASQLGPQDEVTLMSFARGARLVAHKVKGNEAMKLVGLVKAIPSEGGTNLSLAIEQAYATAQQSIQAGTMSRIVLITDGAANLGNANPEDLSKSIEKMRQNGIAFDACGVGADGLDDDMLEALTRKGDGRYYFINRPEDADAGFAQKLAGALRPAAKNVKVQVVFNPERVGNYRLVGFEKHRLKKQDFRNDRVDAAEMAAEEAGNALYQVEARPDGKGDVGTVFVRFRDLATGQMVERSWVIPYQPSIKNLSSAAPSMQLATVAGMLGERLKLGEEAGIDLKQLKPVIGQLRSHFHADKEVKDLIRMCEKVTK
ncbi:MAG: tetratricopeptide (TPR) repeat protein, partial [Cryomorphaceae bacterium]